MQFRQKLALFVFGCVFVVGFCSLGCGEDADDPLTGQAADQLNPELVLPGAPPQTTPTDATPDSVPEIAGLVQVLIHFDWTNAMYVAATGRDLPDAIDINGDGVVDIVDVVSAVLRFREAVRSRGPHGEPAPDSL